MKNNANPAPKGKHGHSPRGKRSRTYNSWHCMRDRCKCPGRSNSAVYFDLGIKVCERWDSFENFLSDMGERPEGTSLDRWPDPRGNYEPGNCRWATRSEQSQNRRTNKLTFETATEIAVRRLRGERCKDLAAEFNVFISSPGQITRGESWPGALEMAKKIIENDEIKKDMP